MVRGYLTVALALAAMSAAAQPVAGRAGKPGETRTLPARPAHADPAVGAAAPRTARGGGRMARSAMSGLMGQTTHDIMMPRPKTGTSSPPPSVPAPKPR